MAVNTLRHLSLWWDTLPDDLAGPVRPPVTDNLEVDVAIVGGGYTGLWTAYYLLRHSPDLRVAVVEAQQCGFGASGRNGGWCSALFPASLTRLAAMSSPDDAQRLYRAMYATVDEVLAAADREGLDIHAAKGGTVMAVRSRTQADRARAQIDEARAFGFGPDDLDLVDADAARARVGMSGLDGALVTPHCAAIHPARLVRGLATTVEVQGAVIHERSPALSIEPGVVRTERGTVRADIIVRATEGYTATLPGLRRELAPVYSLMIATEPLPDEVWERIGLHDRATFNDLRHLIIYGQRTADGRMAFGGRGAPYHFGSKVRPWFDEDPRVFDELHRVLVDLFPPLADARITHRWGGPLGIARDWMASVSLDRRTGLAQAGGYVGDGVGTSNLAGRTLADLILERDTDLVDLPWVGHRSRRWEPEPLRWIGTNLGLRVMTGADEREERSGRRDRAASVIERFAGH